MRRPLWFRALISLWGIWFTTALIEPAGMLACPMHSGVAGVVQGGIATHANGAAASQAAKPTTSRHAHDMSAMSHGEQSLGEPSHTDKAPTEHHCCTCLGQCCAMSPALLPMRASELSSTIVATTVHCATTSTRVSVSRVEHALPFANGPPLNA